MTPLSQSSLIRNSLRGLLAQNDAALATNLMITHGPLGHLAAYRRRSLATRREGMISTGKGRSARNGVSPAA